MNTKNLIKTSVFSLLALAASTTTATTVCPSKQEAPANRQVVCPNVTQNAFRGDVTQLPFAYNNPNADCDLGLSLPGLPNFGLNIGDLNACDIARSLTSRTIQTQLDRIGSMINVDPNRTVNGQTPVTTSNGGTRSRTDIDVSVPISNIYGQ